MACANETHVTLGTSHAASSSGPARACVMVFMLILAENGSGSTSSAASPCTHASHGKFSRRARFCVPGSCSSSNGFLPHCGTRPTLLLNLVLHVLPLLNLRLYVSCLHIPFFFDIYATHQGIEAVVTDVGNLARMTSACPSCHL
jgi:hypothetical protein